VSAGAMEPPPTEPIRKGRGSIEAGADDKAAYDFRILRTVALTTANNDGLI
jgi:hypothetical protein